MLAAHYYLHYEPSRLVDNVAPDFGNVLPFKFVAELSSTLEGFETFGGTHTRSDTSDRRAHTCSLRDVKVVRYCRNR